MNDENTLVRDVFLADMPRTNLRNNFGPAPSCDEEIRPIDKVIIEDIKRGGPISREIERAFGLRRRGM